MQIGVPVSRLIAMDSASRRLCACIGYAIRQAAREKRQDVAQPLWQALHIMTTQNISREPISLWSALGLSEGEFPESALSAAGGSCGPKAGQTFGFLDRTTQTEVEVITHGEFENIMQRNMERLSTYQKTLEALSLRLAGCEQLGETVPVSGSESMSASSFSNPHGAGPYIAGASADGRVVDRGRLHHSLSSIELLKDEHHQRRLALKEQRRAERASHVNECPGISHAAAKLVSVIVG